jgi:carbamoyltransferase
MRILSVYYGHDANCTLLEDGEPVVVIEKERLTRTKHDQGVMDLESILKNYGWDPETIDIIAINPWTRPTLDGKIFNWQLKGKVYRDDPDYMLDGWRGPVAGRCSRHQVKLFGRWYDGYAVDHHLAHIAGAFFTSPFAEAGVLTADGGGDLRMCALAYGSGNKIHQIEYGWGHEHKKLQLNIGSVWASIGEYNFGMKRLEGAGKLMGLASYGTAREEMVEILRDLMLYHPFAAFPSYQFGQRSGLHLEPDDPFAQDICTSLQKVTTEFYLAAAARMKNWKPRESARLIMTGGCSMNCIANTAIHKSGLFEDTWVPAQPHDGGLSLGQALFVWHHVLDHPRKAKALTPYLGTDAGRIDEAVIPEIVDFLEQGKSVGLCYERAESGPRALGHRSILIDPRLPNGKNRLNENVKNREWYRPFAPMVLGDWGVPSKFMSYIVPTDAAEVPAVTHVDGTSRPQIVEPGDDPFVIKLLTAWQKKTGCNVLLNTSFNCQEPLVDTVDQARATWRRTGLDVLVTPEGVETDKASTNSVLNPTIEN